MTRAILFATPPAADGGLAAAMPYSFAVRALGGRVLSAASPYHWVASPSAFFASVLRVDAADAAVLADAAERLLPLEADGDVVSLLLTALVRGGTRVGARDARTQFLWRPSFKFEAEGGAEEVVVFYEDRARPGSAGHGQVGLLSGLVL